MSDSIKFGLIIAAILSFVVHNSTSQVTSINQINDSYLHADSLTYNYPDSALAISDDILITSRELGSEWGIIQSQLIRGIVFYQKNQLDSSLNTLINVSNRAQQMRSNTYEEARARTYLGFIYTRFSKYEKAKENYERAAVLFSSVGDTLLHCANIINVGIVYGMRGDYPRALEYFLEGKEIASKHNTRAGKDRLSAALTNIAVVYSEMGDSEESLKFSREALVIKIEQNDTVSIGTTYNTMGETFAKVGKHDSALYYHNLALELAPKGNLRYRPNVMHAYQSIATIYEERGNLDKAMEMLYASLSYRERNEKIEIDEVFSLLSRYHLKKGNPDSAIYYLRRNIKNALVNGDKKVVVANTRGLHEIFEELKQFDSAYHYLTLEKIYSDSVYNESSNKKYNNLQIELAVAEKQKAIESLEKEQALSTAKRNTLIVAIIGILVVTLSIIVTLVLYLRNRHKKQKIIQLTLEAEVRQVERELQQQALLMINMNNTVSDLEESIKNLKSKKVISPNDVQKVLNGILVNKSLKKEWKQFDSYFSKMHPSFGTKLLGKHSNLTLQERRLISLIKMNLSNREIASILCIEPRSVIMSRYRLKKKLNLSDSQDLESYVHTFTEENDERTFDQIS